MPRRIVRWVAGAAGLVGVALAAIAFWPLRREALIQRTQPVLEEESARERVMALVADAPPGINAACRSTVLDHGRRTPDVYVLLHGLTNCPAQFRAFGDQLYSAGANVIIPRTPYHGLADRLTDDQRLLTAQAMIDSANLAIDLARGYGERVTVIGLSVNAVTAAWLAQTRADIDRAVVIAPFFAPTGISRTWIPPLTRSLTRLPNLFIWWDPRKKTELPGSPFSYPRFATRPIAEVMGLGLDVFERAAAEPPAAAQILVVTSAADTAVNNDLAAELVELWRVRAPGRVATFEFPLEQEIPHDAIDPAQPGARIDIVYPALFEQINGLPVERR